MKKYVIIAYLLAFASVSSAQNHHPDSLKAYIGRSLSNIYLETLSRPTRVAIEKILINDRQKFIELQTNLALSYLPMREQTVQLIYDSVRYHLSETKKIPNSSHYRRDGDQPAGAKLLPKQSTR